MQRLLSTYLFVSRKLTPELLEQIAGAGFQGIEIFCTRSHFEYAMRPEIQAMTSAIEQHGLQLVSLHAPTSRDMSAMRESGTPLSICEIERVRRVEAMDELKRVIDVAEDLPYARLILHMGGARETADPRKRDAAFSSLEHLILHAHHVGVTICVENTTSEMGDPGYLRDFVDETRRCVIFSLPSISTTIAERKTSTFRLMTAPSIGPLPSNSLSPHRIVICLCCWN